MLVMSRQPGRIIDTYSVPLRRPRLPETVLCEEFIELKRCLLGELELVWPERVA
jgi:ABC-type nitrate/sulfonate/bicarbonate transport system ATPase subunit